MTGSAPEVQAPRDTALDDLVLRLPILAPWLSALPLVGICFALPLDCLTSQATRWERILTTCPFVTGPSGEAEAHFDALARKPLPESLVEFMIVQVLPGVTRGSSLVGSPKAFPATKDFGTSP